MVDVDLSGGGMSMIIVGAIWSVASWALSTPTTVQLGLGLVSLGVIVIGFAPSSDGRSESNALTAEDLEDQP